MVVAGFAACARVCALAVVAAPEDFFAFEVVDVFAVARFACAVAVAAVGEGSTRSRLTRSRGDVSTSTLPSTRSRLLTSIRRCRCSRSVADNGVAEGAVVADVVIVAVDGRVVCKH